MATLTRNDLAARVLHKLRVLDPAEPAKPDDLVKALEKLEAAHYVLRGEGLTRWTLADIPEEVQEAYVLIAATLAAPDYGAPVDPSFGPMGLRIVQTFVHVPLSGPCSAENF